MLTTSPRRRSPRPQAPSLPRRSGANDNRPIHLVPPSPRRLAKHGRFLLRMNPYMRVIGDALNILDILSASQSDRIVPSGGWIMTASCGTPDPSYTGPLARLAHNSVAIGGSLNSILTNTVNCWRGSTAFDVGNPFAGVPDTARTVGIGKSGIVGGSIRAQMQECWQRSDRGSERPEYRPAKPPIMLPRNGPEYWPISAEPALAKPLQAPALAPPVPWRLNPSWSAPNREASNGPASARGSVQSAKVPNEWSTQINYGPRAGGEAAPRTHTLAPPRSRGPLQEKEVKLKMRPATAMAFKAVSMGTEGFDFVEVLYSSIPVQYRPRWGNTPYEKKRVTILEKMRTIFEHSEKISWDDFIHNFAAEQFEDFIYGQIGRMGAQISIRQHIPIAGGMNSISTRLRKVSYDVERSERERIDGEN